MKSRGGRIKFMCVCVCVCVYFCVWRPGGKGLINSLDDNDTGRFPICFHNGKEHIIVAYQ